MGVLLEDRIYGMAASETSELTSILLAVIGVVGVVVGGAAKSFFDNRGRDLRRNRLQTDLETIKLLESVGNSGSAEKLQRHVDERIDDLIASETVRSRDPASLGLGLAFLGAAGLLGRTLWVSDWNVVLEVVLWLLVVGLGLFGVVGTSMGLEKTERDDRGRSINGRNKKAQTTP